ncbi:TPA: aminoacyl-histidine dipeptidase [Methanosarcina acetivorans]|uniref:Aminoacyl-histidine dipeptidase n=2 Tax=Methanosarcina acetivorans TaxID=2214 RepID=Q8TMK4_METAC|nr:aminoacyl-histidine dipeptidase [Methanosarcina acetivorans]AAM06031.1 aminoacyl-histidine dipeptidase [Methanosarcina acetivorans C2A]HIH94881.1 aminoacyl-histidine dipeptidase [Methanosarcina acetivorans]
MHPKTRKILEIFEEINKIPRCSKHEERLSLWLQEWGRSRGFEVKTDAVKNVLIKVPATPGYENSPGIVLQGHMDMVCEKSKDSKHDFYRDPIRCVYDGDWLKGDETSIGADNGIALAIGMALSEAGKNREIEHPPLELLFTVDEETGLTGAMGLEKGFVEGRTLLNMDSEDEGLFLVGCAGGKNSRITLPLEWESFEYGKECRFGLFKLMVEGLEGGHSGVEIHRQRANAIQLFARVYSGLREKVGKQCVSLVLLSGGTTHNAIPYFTDAFLALDRAKFEQAEKLVSEFGTTFRSEYAKTDPELVLSFREVENGVVFENSGGKVTRKEVTPNLVFSTGTEEKLLKLLLALPHGVYRLSDRIPGLVETSNNLATVRTGENEITIITNQRSSVMSRLAEITGKVEAAAKLAGAAVVQEADYPAWEPNLESVLLSKCRQVYLQTFEKEPGIEVVHAGLECGVIGSKYEGMEIISLGPTIRDPHSPAERIFIPSIERVWIFLVNLLKSYR